MQLTIRRAQLSDAMDILRWRNDPITCAMSRTQEAISEATHLAWYSKAIHDSNKIFLVGLLREEKIGMVRFDRQQSLLWEVNIAIAPEMRNQGLGKGLLKNALNQFRITNQKSSVLAVIREDNKSSLNLFRSVGFTLQDHNAEYIQLSYYPISTG